METQPIYLIRLHPLDTYFFGGEATFGEDGTNYFAKSNPLPQQTTLLGVLRQCVLFQNRGKNIPDDQLIGAESFKPDGSILHYGYIQRISPLLLFSTDESGKPEFWAPLCRDFPYTLTTQNGQTRFSHDHAKDFVPLLENYKAKDGLKEGFISLNSGKTMEMESDPQKPAHDWRKSGPFHPTFQVGIAKQRVMDQEDDAGGYFKKKAYRLNPQVDFAFFAQLDEAAELRSTVMSVGADGCPFAIQVEKWTGINPLSQPTEFFEKLGSHTPTNRLVCLSDAILQDAALKHCQLATNPVATFRNIRSNIRKTKHYSRLGKSDRDDQPHKTARINLIAKGSAFHYTPAQREALMTAFDQKGYQIIGLNQYYPSNPPKS